MKNVKPTYIIVALILAISVPAMAEDAKKKTSTQTVTTTTETTRVTRPLAVTGDTQEVKPAIQRFVERINMARLNLADGKAKDAVFDLDEAEKHMRFIKQNSNFQEVSKATVISAGEVVYDAEQITYNSFYIPLEEGPVVVKDYVTGENESGKASDKILAVKSAKVVYLNVDLTDTTAEDAIKSARSNISTGNLTAADEILAKMLDQIVSTSSVQNKPEIAVRDNLQLALNFLEKDNHVAARFALAQALETLETMKRSGAYSTKKLDALTTDVMQIKDTSMKETTDATEKARTQIKAAQDDLKDLS
jgi:hypothetical protein